MTRLLSLSLFIALVINGFAKEVELLSTNQDAQGKFLPLQKKSSLGYLSSPVSSFIDFETKVVRMKGGKYHVIIAGALSAKITDRGNPSSVALDAYQDGEFLETQTVKGRYVSVKIKLKDHDTLSRDDVLREGYQKIGLVYIRSKSGFAAQSSYRGKFKLLYEFTQAEVQAHLGALDRPKLMVEIIIPERLGKESESSDPINLEKEYLLDSAKSERELQNAFDEFETKIQIED
jgi:hypothetical protein